MQRRQLFKEASKYALLLAPLSPLAAVLPACGGDGSKASSLNVDEPKTPQSPATKTLTQVKVFGFFQGFGENETMAARNKSRTDGKDMGVLAMTAFVGEKKTWKFKFWHGHSQDHLFIVEQAHLDALAKGETQYLFTTAVDGHKHCVMLTPVFA